MRRCRKTAIGEEADRIRWFPKLDDHGNVILSRPRVESIEPREPAEPFGDHEPGNDPEVVPGVTSENTIEPLPGDYPVPECFYVIRGGDSLARIAKAASALGHAVTMKDILDANPGLNPAKLRVGQKIFIPGPDGNRAGDLPVDPPQQP